MVAVAAACAIMEEWQQYSDPQADILAESAGMRHNAVTLIARRAGEAYELMWCCGITERPKHSLTASSIRIRMSSTSKENIGLIEVLGLAILPPRLETELSEVADYLLGKTADVASCHREWAEELKQQGPFRSGFRHGNGPSGSRRKIPCA